MLFVLRMFRNHLFPGIHIDYTHNNDNIFGCFSTCNNNFDNRNNIGNSCPSQPTTCTVSGSAQSSFCDGVNYFVCTSGTWALSQANSTQCGYVTPAATTPTTPIPATTPTTTTQTPASPTTTSVCSENTQQCSGTTLFICSNGGWIDVEQNSPSCGYVAPGAGTGSSPGAGTNQGSTTFGIDTTTLMYIGLGAVAILGLAALMGGRKRGSSPPPAAPSTPK